MEGPGGWGGGLSPPGLSPMLNLTGLPSGVIDRSRLVLVPGAGSTFRSQNACVERGMGRVPSGLCQPVCLPWDL